MKKLKRHTFLRFWFYLLKYQGNLFNFNHDKAKSVGSSSYVIDGENVCLLFTRTKDINIANKRLEKAKKELIKNNPNSKLEIIPTPEDWLEGNSIIYAMRVARKMQNFSDVAWRFKNIQEVELNTKLLKQEINNKLVKNEAWTNRFKKLMDLINKYEKNPKDYKLLDQILGLCNCLDIFFADKIKKKRNANIAQK
ncbi:hypothetical protein ACFL0A_02090 [Patescibacteria group bacterium]